MSNKAKLIDQVASEITKRFTDEGKLIEAGFAAFRFIVIPKDAPDDNVRAMLIAFMAGAEHLWSSVFNILDPGDEPTARDLARMDLIQKEMDAWRVRLSNYIDPPQGRG